MCGGEGWGIVGIFSQLSKYFQGSSEWIQYPICLKLAFFFFLPHVVASGDP